MFGLGWPKIQYSLLYIADWATVVWSSAILKIATNLYITCRTTCQNHGQWETPSQKWTTYQSWTCCTAHSHSPVYYQTRRVNLAHATWRTKHHTLNLSRHNKQNIGMVPFLSLQFEFWERTLEKSWNNMHLIKWWKEISY